MVFTGRGLVWLRWRRLSAGLLDAMAHVDGSFAGSPIVGDSLPRSRARTADEGDEDEGSSEAARLARLAAGADDMATTERLQEEKKEQNEEIERLREQVEMLESVQKSQAAEIQALRTENPPAIDSLEQPSNAAAKQHAQPLERQLAVTMHTVTTSAAVAETSDLVHMPLCERQVSARICVSADDACGGAATFTFYVASTGQTFVHFDCEQLPPRRVQLSLLEFKLVSIRVLEMAATQNAQNAQPQLSDTSMKCYLLFDDDASLGRFAALCKH